MHEQPLPRRVPGPSLGAWLRRPAIIAPLVLVALLLGTGAVLLVGFAHRSPQPTNGPACPVPHQTVSWPSPPTQVVSYPPTNMPVPVTLQVSESLEVDLPGIWRLSSPSMYAPVLTLEVPAGYTDASGTGCVWHFTAQQAGVVPLEFQGTRGCPVPAASCAMASFQVTVTVTAAKGASLRFRIRRSPSQERRQEQEPLLRRGLLTMSHGSTDATRGKPELLLQVR
jgi:hypothetical protein